MADETPAERKLRESVERLTGERGSGDDRAVLVRELDPFMAGLSIINDLIVRTLGRRAVDHSGAPNPPIGGWLGLAHGLDPGPPDTPTGLHWASFIITDKVARVEVGWNPVAAGDLDYYEIQLAIGGGPPVLERVGGTQFAFNIVPGFGFKLKVRAVDYSGNRSEWAPEIDATAAIDEEPPAKPTGLAASGYPNQIWLTWDANTESDLAFYEIFEALTATPAPGHGDVASFAFNGTAFARTGLGPLEQRFYWLRAVDTSGNRSDWTDSVNATTAVGAAVDPSDLAAVLADLDNAGIVPTNALAANSVTATKLALLDMNNMILNADFADNADGWDIDSGIDIVTPTANLLKTGAIMAVKIPNTGLPLSASYVVSGIVPDSEYLVTVRAQAQGAVRHFTAIVTVDWLDIADAVISTSTAINEVITNTNVQVLSASPKAPVGAVRARINLTRGSGGVPNGNGWMARPGVYRRNAAQLIVDGGIRSNHVTTDEAVITSTAQIANAIITDAKVSDLSAAKLTAGTAIASTITVSGTSLGTIESRAGDPAAVINNAATQIDPGRITISAGTSLADWRGKADTTSIWGGAIETGTVFADQLVANEAVITESAQIANALIGNAHVDVLTSEVFTVNSLLKIEDSGALSAGKTSPADGTDGIFFGHVQEEDGNPHFAFSASRVGGGGVRQEVFFTDHGFSIINGQHYVTAEVSKSVTVTSNLAKTNLPAGTTHFRAAQAIGGGKGGGRAGGNGGNTVIELYDGATLKETITAYGATMEVSSGKRGGVSPIHPYGNGGNGGSYGVGDKTVWANGGKAAALLQGGWLDVSGYTTPAVKITLGAGGTKSSDSLATDGSPGKVVYQTSSSQPVRADVVPIAPTTTGSFAKTASTGGSFPDLGPGLWIIRNATSAEGMRLGTVTIGPATTWGMDWQHESTFLSSVTPTYTGGLGTYTIAYQHFAMGVWGD